MPYQNLIFEKKDHIGTITFNRPRVLNALNRETMDELDALLSEARSDSDLRVLILTGAGDKAFIAGADINELARQTPASGRETSLHGQAVLHKLETLGKPSIAAINGFALGGGCEMALACSIRLASRTAKLGQPEVKLGIIPGYGGTQRLARLCGKGRGARAVPERRDDFGRRGAAHRACKSCLRAGGTSRGGAGLWPRKSPRMPRWRCSSPWKRSSAARTCRRSKPSFWKRRFLA